MCSSYYGADGSHIFFPFVGRKFRSLWCNLASLFMEGHFGTVLLLATFFTVLLNA